MIDAKDLQQRFEMAMRHQQAGHFAEAEALLRQLSEDAPQEPGLLYHLGGCCFYQKNYAEAAEFFRKALKLHPQAGTWCALGHTLDEAGNPAEAEAAFRQASRLDSTLPQTYFQSGHQQMRQGRADLAITAFSALTKMAPDYPNAFFLLGSAEMQCGKTEAAIHSFRKMEEIDPKNTGNLVALGMALHEAGRPEEAISVFRKALNITPDLASAQFGIGTSLQISGDFVGAEREIRKALAMAPERPFYWNALVMTKKFRQADDPDIAAISRLADHAEKFRGPDQPRIFFMLGKIYNDLGRYDDAFAAWQRGNQIQRSHINYSLRGDLDTMNYVGELFTPDYMAKFNGTGISSDLPVFIVGMPRSGSSLVEQILASHSDVFGAGELPDMTTCFAEQICGGTPDFNPKYFTPEAIQRFGTEYLTRLKARAPNAKRIIDKMPGNFPFSGLIHMAMPGAKILHVHRDARDCCLSCYSTQFIAGHPYTYDLKELGLYYRTYEKLMAHWRKVLPEDSFMDVEYEDLVQNFDKRAPEILAFCGLEWQESCRDFYKTNRQVRTASQAQVRQPLYTGSIGRWRRHEQALEPLLRALNDPA